METPNEELTLRDILEILKRQKAWILTLPFLFGVVALIYGFFIAEPTYASTATLSVAPVQVQAQLEQRIQVQQATPITFEGLKALALSEEVVGGVWETLRKEGKLPTRWQDQGGLRGVERMTRDLKIKDISPRQTLSNPNQVPPVVASLTVEAPDPEVAARAANLWVEAVKRQVNRIPLVRLEASLKALEEQIAPAERAYREAQARWEAFNRAATLPQDQAELEAKTSERVSLDQELSGLERDLAAVRGRMAAVQGELARQERLVPIGTPPEQLAVINKRLREAQAALKAEAERARQAYVAAAKALEAFKAGERIPLWQAELSAYTEGYASAQARLIGLEKDLAVKRTQLAEAQSRLAQYKAEVPGLSMENLVAGLTVEEAQALVAKRLKEADARLKGAEAAWQAYQRASQLAVLKQQLGGFADRVAGIRQRLSVLTTTRSRTQDALKLAQERFNRFKAEVPGLSMENLVAGLTVEEAQALVAKRLKEADARLKGAEAAWQAYQRASQLAVLKQQLGGFADRVAGIRQRLSVLTTTRSRTQDALKLAQERFNRFKAEVPGLSMENLVAGLTVEEAQALVAKRLKEADARLKGAEAAWQAYQRASQLAVLKQQLGGFADRVAGVRQRLEKIPTDRVLLQTRLQAAEAELAKEPRLLALEREIVADPVVAAAIARGGDLQALVGLKLKNQELNPTHQKLLFTALDLRADLAALEREERALKEEEAKLLPQVEELQARVAEEEARRSRLLTELDVARDIYNAVYRYAETLKQMASRPQDRLREVSPDVLRYRDQVVGFQAELVALEAEKAALNRNLTEYDKRIQERRARIAAQERERESITLEYGTKKAAYEAFRARYDQIANLTLQDLAFDNPNPEYQRLRTVLIDAQAEEARLLARKAALEARIAQVEARIGVLKDRVARAQVERETLSQALELAKNAYLALAQKRTDLQIQIASNQEAWASILAPAYPIYEKVAPRRGLIFALAVALGLMLGVMAAFVAEALRPQGAPSKAHEPGA